MRNFHSIYVILNSKTNMDRTTLTNEDTLKYLAVLQCQKENSAYICRLGLTIYKSIIQIQKTGKVCWQNINKYLDTGFPIYEGPQESLFTEMVHTPMGSYNIFTGMYKIYSYNLSQMMYLAHRLGLPAHYFSEVLFFLEVSNLIVQRAGIPRYTLGEPYAATITKLSKEQFDIEKDNVCFTQSDLYKITQKLGLEDAALRKYIFEGSTNKLEDDFSKNGFSNIIESHPFYTLKDGRFLILQPCSLLRCAYNACVITFDKYIKRNRFKIEFLEHISQNIGATLQKDNKILKYSSFCGAKYEWFKFDKDKIANIIISLADQQPNFDHVTKNIEEKLEQQFPEYRYFTILVLSQIDENTEYTFFPDNILVFREEEMELILSLPDTTLMTLYYYNIDKHTQFFAPMAQEFDIFAAYYSHFCSFYYDEQPAIFYVPMGSAIEFRSKLIKQEDFHNIPYNNKYLLVKRLEDTPEELPFYAPDVMGLLNIICCEFKMSYIYFTLFSKQDNLILKQITLAICKWIYALESKNNSATIIGNINIEMYFTKSSCFRGEGRGENFITFGIPQNYADNNNFEKEMLISFIEALTKEGYVAAHITPTYIENMFSETFGRFVLINITDNPLAQADGIDACYNINKRCCEYVLDEVSLFINQKGEEHLLNHDESIKVLCSVIEHLRKLVLQLLKKHNTEILLRQLLELNHGLLYWIRLTEVRFHLLNEAYRYIGISYEKQKEYINNYTEARIATEGLIEYITTNDINCQGDTFSCEDIDLLYALMHHICNFGQYLDQLVKRVPNAEITILRNGRIALNHKIIDATNRYFYTLRIQMMKDSFYVEKLAHEIPEIKIDTTDFRFQDSYKEEFGIPYNMYIEVIQKSIDHANQQEEQIEVMTLKDFSDICLKDLSKEQKKEFMEHYVLRHELGNYTIDNSDKFLQRYNRKLQLSSRPWILYNNNIYYSKKILFESWYIQLDRIQKGIFKAETKKMKQYITFIGSTKGHIFNKNVVKYYKSLNREELCVFSEVAIKQNKLLNADKDYGDIDILIINKTKKKIICIEAKDYYEARTTFDLLSQEQKITKDIQHVIERSHWCKTNILQFKKLDSTVDNTYTVNMVYLTYYEPSYKFFEHHLTSEIKFVSGIDIIKNPMCIFD